MKAIKIIFVITILLFTYACNSTKIQKDTLVEIIGTIKGIAMSSCNIANLSISMDENFYASRNEKIELKTYEGKKIRIKT